LAPVNLLLQVEPVPTYICRNSLAILQTAERRKRGGRLDGGADERDSAFGHGGVEADVGVDKKIIFVIAAK
jgi:hypothetical protein